MIRQIHGRKGLLLFLEKATALELFRLQRLSPSIILALGVVRSRWASWSSKPVAGRVAGRGGFDSHPLSPNLVHSS